MSGDSVRVIDLRVEYYDIDNKLSVAAQTCVTDRHAWLTHSFQGRTKPMLEKGGGGLLIMPV